MIGSWHFPQHQKRSGSGDKVFLQQGTDREMQYPMLGWCTQRSALLCVYTTSMHGNYPRFRLSWPESLLQGLDYGPGLQLEGHSADRMPCDRRTGFAQGTLHIHPSTLRPPRDFFDV